MNTLEGSALEDRLREALSERAAHSPISPDAWDKTVARSRRFRLARLRPGLARWLPSRLMIPAGAAVAVIAVALASVAVTGGRPSAVRGPGPSASQSYPPTVQGMLRKDPPFTAVVLGTYGSTRVYFWYSHRSEGSWLCSARMTGPSAGHGGCIPVSLPLSPPQPVTLGGDIAGETTVYYGDVVTRATSVTARLAKTGRSVTGRLVSGRGFPGKVWLIGLPRNAGATIVFRDAAGHEVGHIPLAQVTSVAEPARPSKGGIVVDGWTAYLINGHMAWWGPGKAAVEWYFGWTVGPQPLMVFYQATSPTSYAVGWTPQDVARLALRFPNSVTYAAPTVVGWPGVRLWVRPGVPSNGIPPQTLVISYNAAGKVIAEQTMGSLLTEYP